MRYDRARESHNRHATYIVAASIAGAARRAGQRSTSIAGSSRSHGGAALS
jgi:hypothetical protein